MTLPHILLMAQNAKGGDNFVLRSSTGLATDCKSSDKGFRVNLQTSYRASSSRHPLCDSRHAPRVGFHVLRDGFVSMSMIKAAEWVALSNHMVFAPTNGVRAMRRCSLAS